MKTLIRALLWCAPALAFAAPALAQTQTNLTIKDGNGATQNLCEYTLSSAFLGCMAPHFFNGATWGPQPADSSFRPYVNTLPSGTTGTNYSANTPTLPTVGSAFAASGPYASYVLIATVPASPTGCVHVENDSGAQIALVLDDGTAAGGAAPNNASVFALGGGSGIGAQGGSTGSEFCNFKGRVQVYAPSSTAQVFAARW